MEHDGVMVVAILMTYIGFNGMADHVLPGLHVHSQAFAIIATDHISLQPGYLVLMGFVLYGLFFRCGRSSSPREQCRVLQHAN